MLLGFFGLILIVNIGTIFTAIGFYQFISNFGIFTTILGAVFYIYHTYKQTNRERSVI